MAPARRRCWPGNTNDQTILPEVKDGLRGWRLGRVVTVIDRGFSSDANLAYLRRAGGHWIAGERMRDGSADAQEALSRQGRYQDVRGNLRVKEVQLDSTPDRRWIVCHNPAEAERDKAQRDAIIARLEAVLDAIAAARARDAAKARKSKSKRKPTDETHRKAECALRDHPTLGRRPSVPRIESAHDRTQALGSTLARSWAACRLWRRASWSKPASRTAWSGHPTAVSTSMS